MQIKMMNDEHTEQMGITTLGISFASDSHMRRASCSLKPTIICCMVIFFVTVLVVRGGG